MSTGFHKNLKYLKFIKKFTVLISTFKAKNHVVVRCNLNIDLLNLDVTKSEFNILPLVSHYLLTHILTNNFSCIDHI